MTGSPSPPDPQRLRYRAREHELAAEEALDRDDLVAFSTNRHLASLEHRVADEDEDATETRR